MKTDELDPEPDDQTQVPLTSEVTNRFLFVDIAALRAKQLRRGATARIENPSAVAHKPERVAMEEVRRGFVQYDVPGSKVAPDEETA
jgi:DNA-directed RNA polymerase omega subunit